MIVADDGEFDSNQHALILIINLLPGDDLFDSNSSLNSDLDSVFSISPVIADFISHLFGVGGKVEVGLLVSGFVHEGEFVTIDVNDFPVGTVDNWNGGSVGGWNHILELLSGENISSGEVALGVTVFSGLRNGDRKNLAWLSLDHHVSTVF